MRTAAICPTCATYENALCVLYNGSYLFNTGIAPLDSMEVALQKIDPLIVLGISSTNGVLNINAGAPEYADNAAAISAGLMVGDIYRTGDFLKIVH